MDESMEKLHGLQEEIQNENRNESGPNPALLMYREVVDQLHVFEVRLRLYRKEIKKKRSADAAAEKQLRIVRDTYRDCVIVLFSDERDKLPGYNMNRLFKNVPAYPEEIIGAISGGLGVETHITPLAESCSLYKKRAADFRRDYNLAP
jgi:hypothetical protein